MLNVFVISITKTPITGYELSNGPIHLKLIPYYSTERVDGVFEFEMCIDILVANRPNAKGFRITTLFDTQDRSFNHIPTDEDRWFTVDMGLVAIDHARLLFHEENEKLGLDEESYLPLFDREEVFLMLKDANFQAMN